MSRSFLIYWKVSSPSQLIHQPRCCRVGRSASPFLIGHLTPLCFGDQLRLLRLHTIHIENTLQHVDRMLQLTRLRPNPTVEGPKYSNIHFSGAKMSGYAPHLPSLCTEAYWTTLFIEGFHIHLGWSWRGVGVTKNSLQTWHFVQNVTTFWTNQKENTRNTSRKRRTFQLQL